MTEYIQDKAKTAYGDWRGTSSADVSMMSNIKSMEELAGIHEDNELIIGIGAGWTASGQLGARPDFRVYVYVADTPEEANMTALLKKYPEGENVPVKEVQLHDITPEQFALAFTQFDVQLRSRFLGDRDLRVIQLGDHPKQD
ncbi:hypothetical protein [Glutamicibacter sp. M10]|uniref:hypothetical protein n=1 Tax=Glutamicibacter sp. M10 TaxID=3023076 RepID=UPI0021C90861|nr:hypothetical protein [Glutamicibacter sp. M10]UXN30688.1 hypothetical protein N6V40_09435 [Glutamicibacter sp. M10]